MAICSGILYKDRPLSSPRRQDVDSTGLAWLLTTDVNLLKSFRKDHEAWFRQYERVTSVMGLVVRVKSCRSGRGVTSPGVGAERASAYPPASIQSMKPSLLMGKTS